MTDIELTIEKPAAGGRMLARHQGQVVLVWGAIPGERVRARVERSGKGVLFAETTEVVEASPDRRAGDVDWRCGGNVLAHVAYDRQLQLKAEIVRDAFTRIGRMPLAALPSVVASPERGYRMRARLHVSDGRIGFFREATHALCDAAGTGQLLPQTTDWIAEVEQRLDGRALAGMAAMEIAENVAGDERACHLDLHAGVSPSAYAALAPSLVGLSACPADAPQPTVLAGVPHVTDVVALGDAADSPAVRLRRDVRAFFQGNRFLLTPFVRHVTSLVDGDSALDLYAGVGLFGLALAAAGLDGVTLVEGDLISGTDLAENARPFGDRVRVVRRSVEGFLAGEVQRRPPPRPATAIVDPPRTGLSKEALASLITLGPPRIVYVSCDVPTLARDARMLVDAGYEMGPLTGFDLFPNTAHVEVVTSFARPAR